jgi:tellurite resistance protein TehA-like permease
LMHSRCCSCSFFYRTDFMGSTPIAVLRFQDSRFLYKGWNTIMVPFWMVALVGCGSAFMAAEFLKSSSEYRNCVHVLFLAKKSCRLVAVGACVAFCGSGGF